MGSTNTSASIVICNYNYAQYVEHAIQSALAQTYPCEVVVVDDGSTDASLEVIRRFSDRVTVVEKPNGGQCSAYNAGFERTTGDVVLFLDADDILETNAMERVVGAMVADTVKVHYRLRLIDSLGNPSGGVVPTIMGSGDCWSGLVERGLLYPSAPATGNAYARRALEVLMPLPLFGRIGADFYLVYGTPKLGKVAAIDEILGKYRIHSPTATTRPSYLGNSETGPAYRAGLVKRAAEFRRWMHERTGYQLDPEKDLRDFSALKIALATNPWKLGYFERVSSACKSFPEVSESIWFEKGSYLRRKLMLTSWVLAVALAPNKVAQKLGNKGLDPRAR